MGCGNGSKQNVPRPDDAAKPPPESQVVNVSEAEATKSSGQPKNEKLWTIRWKRAQLEYAGDKDFGGTMETVTGTIYQDGEPVSDFRADYGQADKKSELLTIYGNVRVEARKVIRNGKAVGGGGVLTCERMEWLPSRKLIAAKGLVSFKDPLYEAGTFNELWATPKMDSVGTPDQFGEIEKK